MPRSSAFLACAFLASTLIHSQAFTVSTSRSLFTGSLTRHTTRPSLCSIVAMSPQEEGDAMMKSLQNHIETVKGTEAMPASTAENLIQEAKGENHQSSQKVLGSRRLGKVASMVSSKQEEINLKLGFQHLMNELTGLMGSEGFKGKEAEAALREVQASEDAIEKDKGEPVLKLLGSRRLYKLVKKTVNVANRPRARKNHPGETFSSDRHA